MRTADIARILDEEFRVVETADPGMTKHALSDIGRGLVLPAFHEGKTGLMFDFGDTAEMTYCATFLTAETVRYVLGAATVPALLFTHHPFDYHEDDRGVSTVPDDRVDELKLRRISVYAIHAPLDVGRNIWVSGSLVRRLGLSSAKPFFPACGGYLGVCGTMPGSTLPEIARTVGRAMGLETVDVFNHGGPIGLTAIVAGGGDQVEILQAAIDLGCTTYVTGTAVHRWQRDGVQRGNREFHGLARRHHVNLIGATHYNTEKCAVKDVAEFLLARGVPAAFVEDPVLRVYAEGNFAV